MLCIKYAIQDVSLDTFAKVYLNDNYMSDDFGTLQIGNWNLDGLEVLDISNNLLYGGIHESFSSLDALEEFNANENFLGDGVAAGQNPLPNLDNPLLTDFYAEVRLHYSYQPRHNTFGVNAVVENIIFGLRFRITCWVALFLHSTSLPNYK